MNRRRRLTVQHLVALGVLGGGGAAVYLLADGVLEATAAYGVRKLRKEYTGNLIRLRRSSDNAELDFGFLPNGDLDVAAITSWLAGASGFLRTWYDQSGNARNAVQATTTRQPQYVLSGINSKPSFQFTPTPSAKALVATFGATITQPNTLLAVAKYDATGGGGVLNDGIVGGSQRVIQDNNAGSYLMYAGASLLRAGLDTNPHLINALYNGASSSINTDSGTPTTGNAGSENVTGITLGTTSGLTGGLNGDVAEWLLIPRALTAPEIVTVEDNMAAYWGI